MSDEVPYHNSISELHDALEHISRMARASKTQTKRLRRIAMRADAAREGRQFDPQEACDLPEKVRSPMSYEKEIRFLKREIADLKKRDQECTT